MEKYIYDNSNGLWYELQGDYYIPCRFYQIQKNARLVSGAKNIWITSKNIVRYDTPIWFSAVSYTVIWLILILSHRLS